MASVSQSVYFPFGAKCPVTGKQCKSIYVCLKPESRKLDCYKMSSPNFRESISKQQVNDNSQYAITLLPFVNSEETIGE